VNRVACVASSLRVRTESGRSTWRRRPEEQEVDDRQDATEEQAPEEARGPATEIHHSREGEEKKERKKKEELVEVMILQDCGLILFAPLNCFLANVSG